MLAWRIGIGGSTGPTATAHKSKLPTACRISTPSSQQPRVSTLSVDEACADQAFLASGAGRRLQERSSAVASLKSDVLRRGWLKRYHSGLRAGRLPVC